VKTLSRSRRFLLAGGSALLAAALFRGQVSDALITRGDDQLRFGDRADAIRYYERSLRIAPRNTTAADRLAFTLAMQRDPRALKRAIAISTRALAGEPSNLALLADRAFAEMRLRQTLDAARDFAAAAGLGHDARYASFAARLARTGGDRELALREAGEALRDDPAFAPARLETRRSVRR